jgi:hypothetical protein
MSRANRVAAITGAVLAAFALVPAKAAERELAEIGRTIRKCIQSKWKPSQNPSPDLIVKVLVHFNADGSLAKAPTVVNQNDDPAFRAASENAVKALHACEPFKLPKDKYEMWKEMLLRFDPSEAR